MTSISRHFSRGVEYRGAPAQPKLRSWSDDTLRGWSITAAPRPITGSISTISGTRMRQLLGLVFYAALASAATASAADAPSSAAAGWSLDALMASLHQVRTASAHFVELKTVGMLTRPIRTTGILSYVAPDKLEKIITAPARETIRLDGNRLTGTRNNGEK